MASTTAAAASMLLSGSMPSADGSAGLMSSNFLARTVLPCSSSMATISASAPFPTVTLDLTHAPSGAPNAVPLNAARPPAAPAQFQVPLPGSGVAPAFAVPPQVLYNQSKFSGLQMSSDSAAAAAQFAQPRPPIALAGPLSDTVSAAAAAITADPNFTVALAEAITSFPPIPQTQLLILHSNNMTSGAATTGFGPGGRTLRQCESTGHSPPNANEVYARNCKVGVSAFQAFR
ncbi:hypothetical protein ABZP36_015659 [Zizania latifolia]